MEHTNRWALVDNRIVYILSKTATGYHAERNGKEFDIETVITESFEKKADVLKPSSKTIMNESVQKVLKKRGRKPMFNEDGTRKHVPCANKGKYGSVRGRPRLVGEDGLPIVREPKMNIRMLYSRRESTLNKLARLDEMIASARC
jgi:hypothetical protein